MAPSALCKHQEYTWLGNIHSGKNTQTQAVTEERPNLQKTYLIKISWTWKICHIFYSKNYCDESLQQELVGKVSPQQFAVHPSDLVKPTSYWMYGNPTIGKSQTKGLIDRHGVRSVLQIGDISIMPPFKVASRKENLCYFALKCQHGAPGICWTPYPAELLTSIDLKFLFWEQKKKKKEEKKEALLSQTPQGETDT